MVKRSLPDISEHRDLREAVRYALFLFEIFDYSCMLERAFSIFNLNTS